MKISSRWQVLRWMFPRIRKNAAAGPHAKCYHLNFYDEHPEEGKEFPLPTYVYEDMAGQNAYIKERTEAGFLCCYNHPYWSLQNYDDYKDFEGLWAMEIYNHGCRARRSLRF